MFRYIVKKNSQKNLNTTYQQITIHEDFANNRRNLRDVKSS